MEKTYRIQFQQYESGLRGNWQRQWAHVRHDNRLRQLMAAYRGGTAQLVSQFLKEAKEHTIQIQRGKYFIQSYQFILGTLVLMDDEFIGESDDGNAPQFASEDQLTGGDPLSGNSKLLSSFFFS